jgi:hypothetical protein
MVERYVVGTFGKRPGKVQEKRRAHRARVSLNATIMFGGNQAIRCSIVDISSAGARLLVPSVLGIPERFQLRDDQGSTRQVEVSRRGTGRLGVTFL